MAAGGKGIGVVGHVWSAVKELNPESVKREINQVFSIAVIGDDAQTAIIVSGLTEGADQSNVEGLISTFKQGETYDIVICAVQCTPSVTHVDDFRLFLWNWDNPEITINEIISEGKLSYLHTALANRFPRVAKVLTPRIIRDTSVENAIFVASTAVGTIIPSPLSPLISVAEAAGDLVVLSANQVRMLFKLAAANARPVGYKELWPQVGSIIAAAFGWRAIARELVGLIPMGGGILAKATVAYAGTWTIGQGIIYYFATGRKMTGEEMRKLFENSLESARQAAAEVVENVKSKTKTLIRPQQ